MIAKVKKGLTCVAEILRHWATQPPSPSSFLFNFHFDAIDHDVLV
jgi:hypothetical protein